MVAVDDEIAAAAVGIVELVLALVVAEKVGPLSGDACFQSHVQLPRGDHVEPEPLLGHHTQELGRIEGFRRVENQAGLAERANELRGPLAHRVLVVDVERSAVRLGEVEEVTAADFGVAALVDPVADREEQLGLG